MLLDLAELGVPAGSEFLDTISPQFIADLISWGAIGARTTESQVHRELASGLSVPVGFKNGTDGNVQIAIDAIRAARGPHHFLSVTKQGLGAIVTTTGNDALPRHPARRRKPGPNYDADERRARSPTLLRKLGLPRSRDGRLQPRQQPEGLPAPAASSRAMSRSRSRAASDAICGVMIESHLVEGRQDLEPGKPLVYGQSITDACISWETTVPVLDDLAEAVRARRRGKSGARAAISS